MRFGGMLAVGAVIVALATVSGCGNGDSGGIDSVGNGIGGEGSSGSSDGYGQSAGSGGRLADAEPPPRPSAATMADLETFVSQRTTCADLHMEDSLDEDDPDAESVGKGWGIKERAVCWDEERNDVTLMSIDDMKAFQVQAKKHHDSGYLLGQDFAVTGHSVTTENLKDSGLLALICDAETRIPSGYKKEKALVDGCTLTDFIP